MSSSAQLVAPASSPSSTKTVKIIALTAVLLAAAAFVARYPLYYYLHFSQSGFTNPQHGAPNYWVMRVWLLLHITGGMIALLIGPWQFSQRLRRRYLRLHRLSGRVCLISVMCASLAAFRLAAGTSFGRAFGFGLMMLAVAWITTSGMAYHAILKRQIPVHKEWMVRSYVVTFAFVTFRAFNDYPPMNTWLPVQDLAITNIWACWAVPLLFTEMFLQFARMRQDATAKAK